MEQKKFELGAKARDVVSGWEGIITAEYRYMNGCLRYEISGADKEGKPEGFVFDSQQIESLAPPMLATAPPVPTGGPRDNRPVAR